MYALKVFLPYFISLPSNGQRSELLAIFGRDEKILALITHEEVSIYY